WKKLGIAVFWLFGGATGKRNGNATAPGRRRFHSCCVCTIFPAESRPVAARVTLITVSSVSGSAAHAIPAPVGESAITSAGGGAGAAISGITKNRAGCA